MRDQLADDVSKKCKNSNKVKNNDPVDAQAEAGVIHLRLSLSASLFLYKKFGGKQD